jgi:hypothetical protein
MTAAVGQVLRYMGLVVGHWVQKVEPRAHGKCRFRLSVQASASSSARSQQTGPESAEVGGGANNTHLPSVGWSLNCVNSSVMKDSRFYSSPSMAPNQTGRGFEGCIAVGLIHDSQLFTWIIQS